MSQKKMKLKGVYLTESQLKEYLKHHPKTPTFEKEIEIGMCCDVCGKTIPNGEKYISVYTGHQAWGNDSIDSFEWKDACSTECAMKLIHIFNNLYNSNENWKTDQIELRGDTAHYYDIFDMPLEQNTQTPLGGDDMHGDDA